MNSHICPSCCLPTQEEIASNFPDYWEVLGCIHYRMITAASLFCSYLFFCLVSVFLPVLMCVFLFVHILSSLFHNSSSVYACLSLPFFHTPYFNTPFIAVISHLPQLSATFCFVEGSICDPNINKTVGMKNQFRTGSIILIF